MQIQTQQLIVRTAKVTDLAQLKCLFTQLIDNVHPNIHAMEDVLLEAYDDDFNRVYVVESNGVMVGTAQVIIYNNLIRTPKRKAIIDSVIVDEKQRGLNIGKKLITHIIDYCITQEVGKITLVSSYKRFLAYPFYRSVGFRDCGLGFELELFSQL